MAKEKVSKKQMWINIADQVIEFAGGHENIKEHLHCATRLRLVVEDNDLVNEEGLKKLEHAKAVVFNSGQWQIIFGPGTVNKVYDALGQRLQELNPLLKSSNSSSVSNTGNGSQPWWDSNYTVSSNMFSATRRTVKNFGDIFIPLIPIFIAAGVSLAFKVAVETMVPTESGVSFAFASILGIIADTLFGMLPVFIAWSMMKKLGGPQVYGIAVGLVLISPSLVSMGSVQTPISIGLHYGQSLDSLALSNGWVQMTDGQVTSILVNGAFMSVGDTITDTTGTINYVLTSSDINSSVAYLFNDPNGYDVDYVIKAVTNGTQYGTIADMANAYVSTYTVLFNGIFSISLIGYQSQIIAALLSTALIYYVYKGFVSIMPEAIAIVFVPLLTIFLSTWLILWIVGPIGRVLNTGMVAVFTWIYANLNFAGFGLGAAILAALLPLLVVTGLHNSLIIVEMTTMTETAAQYGHSFTFNTPLWFCVHMGISGALIAYLLIVKNQKAKSIAVSGIIPVNLGISEPALYGTCVRLGYPLAAGMIGAFAGGLWVGGVGALATTNGSASWIGLVQFDWTTTQAYLDYTADSGIPAIMNAMSPGVKMVIGMVISTVVGFTALIILSNTQWAKSANRAFNEETLTYSELLYIFTPAKTLGKEDLVELYNKKYNGEISDELQEAFEKKAQITNDIYQLKLMAGRSKHDYKIYDEILQCNIELSRLKQEIKTFTKHQTKEIEDAKVVISNLKEKINTLKQNYKKSPAMNESELEKIKKEVVTKQNELKDLNISIKSL